MEHYHIFELIGEGSFGRVYRGRRKCSRQVVALKFIPKAGRSEKELRCLKREIDIMRGLKHPNVVQLLDSFETGKEVVVVTEYAEGELFQILEDDGSLPEHQVRDIACQLVSALYYLHSHRILHRDMKPQNILLGKGGVMKLCDFGFARVMSISTLVLTSIKGTPLYMSPELVEEKPYDHTADLWSLGCILYELLTGTPPFYTNSIFQLVKLIVRDPVKWPDNMSPICVSFLKGLLTKEPQKRLSWPALLHHPYVADRVIVLSDEGSISPLTVTPSPDVQALKQQQASQKALPHAGESKLLRRAREQREKKLRNAQDQKENIKADYDSQPRARTAPAGEDQRENSKVDCSSQPRSKTAPAGDAPPRTRSLGSTYTVCRNSALPPARQNQENNFGVARLSWTPRKGPISVDYEREFPSVEVESRRTLRRPQPGHTGLASVRMDSDEQDGESDEEWQQLAEKTDWTNTTEPSIHHKLKNKLLKTKEQLSGGKVKNPDVILQPLKVLKNLVLTSDPAEVKRLCEELDLLNILFSLIEETLNSPRVMKDPGSERTVGELMTAVLLLWEKNPEWEMHEKSAEDLCQMFISVFLRPDPNLLAPIAAAVLSMFVQRCVCVNVQIDKLTDLLMSLLSGSHKLFHPLPGHWGLCDGILALILHVFSEQSRSSDISDFVRSELWKILWTKAGAVLDNAACRSDLSVNGICKLLSLTLLAFSEEPYDCVGLFFGGDEWFTLILSCLLTLDNSAEITCRLPWAGCGVSSLSMMSCHLLSYPFSLEQPKEKMAKILQSYLSGNVVAGLVQVIQTQPPELLEIPLYLLGRLCLSSPQHAVRSFNSAAQASNFLPKVAEVEQTLNSHLNGTRVNGNQQKNKANLSKSKGNQLGIDSVATRGGKGDLKVQLPSSKVKFAALAEKGEKCKSKEDCTEKLDVELLSCLEPCKGSLEELVDSLELNHSFPDPTLLDWKSTSWFPDNLREGRSVKAPKYTAPEFRTASSLLSVLLQDESLCAGATQLLILLGYTSDLILPVESTTLRLALCHADDGIRASACDLLTHLEPRGGSVGPPLFRELLRLLCDPAPSVRRSACKAAGRWLEVIRQIHFTSEVSNGDGNSKEGGQSKRRRGVRVEGGGNGGLGSNVRPLGTIKEEVEWLKVVMETAAPAVSLLSDPDAVIRRHACLILTDMALIEGGERVLIGEEAPRQVLQIAHGDSHHVVRRQAVATLQVFGKRDKLQQMIGEGSFGRVYRGRRKYSRQIVALKVISKLQHLESEVYSIKREIDIMQGLKHPNIIQLLDSFETEKEVVLVTECAVGELFQVLLNDGSLPESQVRDIACQLVSALYYLHSHRILHRDMKPQNILLDKGGVVKLCDFGFAQVMSMSTLVLTSIKGTPLYMSPEVLKEQPYDHTADLWSLGCILYELHTGTPPFYNVSFLQLRELIVQSSVKWSGNMSQNCKCFLMGLLTKNPQKRLTWPALLHHPFVADRVKLLPDEGLCCPLTVTPSPDMLALKQHQAKEKMSERRKKHRVVGHKERRQKGPREKEKHSWHSHRKTAPAGDAPATCLSSGSTCTVCRNPPANQEQANDIGVASWSWSSCKGPISIDYEREFPSVEVGPRVMLKCSKAEDTTVNSNIHQTLMEKLLKAINQLLGGKLKELCIILHSLKVLKPTVLDST